MKQPTDQQYWTQTAEQVLKQLNVSAKTGLSAAEVAKRLKQSGLNEITAKEQTTVWTILLNQFKNFFVLLLLAAAVFSLLVGEPLDAVIIVVVVGVNVVIGFMQEFKAAKALAALKKLFVAEVTVIRDGHRERLPRTQLVPGDMVLLETGDKVAADLRLVEVRALKIDESTLTGESTPVVKTIDRLDGDKAMADRVNMVFAGTLVVYGKGQGLVVATGDQTEFGKIAHLVAKREESTPLEQRLHVIGEWFSYGAIAIGLGVFILGLARGQAVLDMFTFVIALLVAAVPESLPVVMTLALAFGAIRLAKSASIIRRLPVVETLGDVEVIACDKTGTLTRNEMTVTDLVVVGRSGLVHSEVGGVGYVAEGELENPTIAQEPNFVKLIETGVRVNESEIHRASADHPEYSIVGDPTEAALLVLAEKVGRSVSSILKDSKRLDELPFDPTNKFMATLDLVSSPTRSRVSPSGARAGQVISVKGAPEVVLAMCKLNSRLKKAILEQVDELAHQGLRTLGLAGQPTASSRLSTNQLNNLTFYGLVGMLDPVRAGVKEALAITERAGIRTIIVTGDHQLTAQAIARQLGMADGRSLTGQDLSKMTDSQLSKQLTDVSIYARTSPEDKLRLVKLLEGKGQIVAVTGDGINDAPALKAAHVGVAMGRRGTDVARETADLILVDDSFATIVKSVEMGRGIFDNIKKFIILLLSGNIVEVLIVGVAFLSALPAPFTTIQILWINLVTDSFPALALGFDPPKPNILRERPELRNRGIVRLILSRSILMAGAGFSIAWAIFFMALKTDVEYARTMTFTFIVFFELVTVFLLAEDRPIWRAWPRSSWLVVGAVVLSIILQLLAIYGPGEQIFQTSFLTGRDWLILGGGLVLYYLLADIIKIFTSR